VCGTLVAWASRQELVSSFAYALRWETVVLAWLGLIVVTTCHEFAHGLTCKHFGGEVHEVGFLMIYLTPAFYCNVSDAWLFREKSKRLWVMLAGSYCDWCLWSILVVVCRLTIPNSLINYLSWLMVALLGARIFFNLNPLIKLDGYYLLSDWVEIPNLRQRSMDYLMSHLRWLLWGGSRPEREDKGAFLLGFGIMSWVFSLVFLALGLSAMFRFMGQRWGALGVVPVAWIGFGTMRSMVQDLGGGEVRKMILRRHTRSIAWVVAVVTGLATLYFVKMEDRVGATFQVRATTRAELRSPTSGFLREVYFDQGERISPGETVVRIEVPDLTSRIAQKRAEIEETQAQLRLLQAGARPEALTEQRDRVQRAIAWRDFATVDLARARQAHEADLARLNLLIAEFRTKLDFAQRTFEQYAHLVERSAVARAQLLERKEAVDVYQSRLEQYEAEKRSREALGSQAAEEELARRQKDLGDAQGTLKLLEAKARPEEIDAAEARLRRLKEDGTYLEELMGKLQVFSPVSGCIVTPHLKERSGQYLKEGDLICTIEDSDQLEVEMAVEEQQLTRVQPGQQVELKVRAMPFSCFQAEVVRLAPSATRLEALSTPVVPAPTRSSELTRFTVYCHLDNTTMHLHSGMTGYARIHCGKRRVAEIVYDRVARYMRTEFWW
jgi:multidrug resistance efflux pump